MVLKNRNTPNSPAKRPDLNSPRHTDTTNFDTLAAVGIAMVKSDAQFVYMTNVTESQQRLYFSNRYGSVMENRGRCRS